MGKQKVEHMVSAIRRSDNGIYRVHCINCYKELSGQQKAYCSVECKTLWKDRCKKDRDTRELEQRRKALEEKIKAVEIANAEKERRREEAIRHRTEVCPNCVWHTNGICVMPSCFKLKGMR